MIDADYRGEVKVLLYNFSDDDFEGASLSFFLASSAEEETTCDENGHTSRIDIATAREEMEPELTW